MSLPGLRLQSPSRPFQDLPTLGGRCALSDYGVSFIRRTRKCQGLQLLAGLREEVGYGWGYVEHRDDRRSLE